MEDSSTSRSPPSFELLTEQDTDLSERRPGDALAIKAALISIAIFVLTSWLSILNQASTFGWFALHPPLQSAALSIFTYGIVTLQPASRPRTKAEGLYRHQVAMIGMGLPLITLGVYSVWHNKVLHGKEHFVTWHGTMGLLCVIWLAFQIIVGGGSVWFGGALFGGGRKAKALWKYHRLSGCLLFSLLFFTAHLGGAWSAWSARNTNIIVRFLAFTVAPVIVVVSVFSRVRLSKMQFR